MCEGRLQAPRSDSFVDWRYLALFWLYCGRMHPAVAAIEAHEMLRLYPNRKFFPGENTRD